MDDHIESRFAVQDLRNSRPELAFAYRGLVPGPGQWGNHAPGWFSCWLIEQGWAEVVFPDGPTVRAGVGQWLLLPSHRVRQQRFPRGANILSIAFQLVLPAVMSSGGALPMLLPRGEGAELTQAAESLLASCAQRDEQAEQLRVPATLGLRQWFALQTALMAFTGAWCARVLGDAPLGKGLDPRVAEARRLLATMPRMGTVPYDVLRRRTGLSRVQLDRLFREQLGHSPKEELDRRCLERVQRRLVDPTLPIKAIAAELGFTDSSHLCRWFTRRTGMSPQRHRLGRAL